MTPDFSIIIPFKAPSAFLVETLDRIGELAGPSFEVILLPDEECDPDEGGRPYPVTVIPTGEVSPAVKRDRGADEARGEFLAFIDDDAYPAADWLVRIGEAFDSPDVVGVGGPQITPASDPFWAQVSGAMFLSCLNGGAVHRYQPVDGRFDVDDWPSVNLCVRRESFLAVGGFDSAYWPGEDTKLCLDLTKHLGGRIVYCGAAVVHHHRRAGLRRHLRQVGGYGLHRGYFARSLPETSLRPAYFVPSLFFLFVTLGLVSTAFWGVGAQLYGVGLGAYLVALLVSLGCVQARVGNWGVAAMAQVYLACTHYWYGFQFLRGILSRRGPRQSRGR